MLGVLDCAEPVIVYDRDKIVEKLAEEMPMDDAREYFDFNIDSAYMGPGTPLFVYPDVDRFLEWLE